MKCCFLNYYYRPQTKFAKVMFSQVSVCPQGGNLDLCPGGVSVQEGLRPGGRGDLCPGGLCQGDPPGQRPLIR